MSDDTAKHFEEEKQEAVQPTQRSVTLSVTLQPDQSVQFQMPMGNKILAYGMLELARAQLDKLYLMEELQKSQASRGGIAGLVKRMNGG